jgi:hypothetical protein
MGEESRTGASAYAHHIQLSMHKAKKERKEHISKKQPTKTHYSHNKAGLLYGGPTYVVI